MLLDRISKVSILLFCLTVLFYLLAQMENITVVGHIGKVVLLKNSQKQIKAHKVGQEIFNTGQILHQVLPDRIIVKSPSDGEKHIATKLQTQKQVEGGHRTDRQAGGDTYTEQGLERVTTAGAINIKMDASFKDNVVKNLPKVVMEASSEVVPLPEGGVGVKIFNFSENSLFAKLGLDPAPTPDQANMITEINGQKIENAVQAIKLLRGAEKSGAEKLSFKVQQGDQVRDANIRLS